MNNTNTKLKRFGVWLLRFGMVVAATLIVALILGLKGAPYVTERGGKAEVCYPNDTCDDQLTCWEVGKEHLCYADISPVVKTGTLYCYITRDPDGQLNPDCFKEEHECGLAFSEVAKTTTPVARGCGPGTAIPDTGVGQ